MCAALLGFALLLPGLVNGYPLLFPDSIGYYHAGEAALREIGWKRVAVIGQKTTAPAMPTLADRANDTVSTVRSVYYGIFFVIFYRFGGAWGLPVAQAAIVGFSLWLALRHLIAPQVLRATTIIAALATLGGLGVFTVAAMPDVFTGLTILGLALVLAADSMPRRERAYWLGIVLVACLFHKANLAIAVAIIIAYTAFLVVRRKRVGVVAWPVATLAAAIAAHAAVGVVVDQLLQKPAVEVSFLLSRAVGDGTVEPYLNAHCPASGLVLCRYVDRFPMSTDEFLWSADPRHGLLKLVSPAERVAIAAEANTVVWGAIREHPLAQLRASLANFGGQLVNVGATQFGIGPISPPGATPGLSPLLVDYRDSRVAHRRMPLGAMSRLMALTYFAGALILALLLWRRPGRARILTIAHGRVVALLVGGVIVNAAVCGVVAGNYDRYQGRVAWLIPFTTICVLSWWWQRRRPEARLIADETQKCD